MERNDSHSSSRLPRRQVLQWIAAAGPAAAIGIPAVTLAQADKQVQAEGYGTDPDLVKVYEPGDVWPLTFSESQRKTVTALADTVLPADDYGPAASAVRVPDYIDEWISAPYEKQQKDRKAFLPGLAKFEEWVKDSYQASFTDLSEEKRNAVCEAIVSGDGKALRGFFDKFVSLACGAYYTTTEGWKAIGYVGNMATVNFDGPPQEVLDRVGVEQTVKD